MLADRLRRNRLLRPILIRRYERYFTHAVDTNIFRGVYASFAKAAATIPPTKPAGYDHPAPAAMYADRLERIHTSDYPVLFWLGRLLTEQARVFDFGGHVGIAFYAFQRILPFPPGLTWRVLDVPAVLDAGRHLAATKGAAGLSFTDAPADADGSDVFLASGSLQYVETPLAGLLAQLEDKPRYLLINKLPIHPRLDFVTLQNIGTAFCPYRIFARSPFVEALVACGYRLIDEWQTTESCHIPYEPACSVARYSGFCFERV